MLFNDAPRIEELYKKSGFSGTKIESVADVNEEIGEADAIFEITE
jgi:hypothetical protein